MYSMPVGLDNFREMIAREYYFVDKTKFIKELLDSNAMVTLITRPRRFGKTLAMRMLQEFFDINAAGRDTFKGLNISRAGEKYTKFGKILPRQIFKTNLPSIKFVLSTK